MKYLLLLLPLFSCVTPSDVRQVAYSVEEIGRRQEQLANRQITGEQFQEAIQNEVENINRVAQEAMERSGNIVKGIGGALTENPGGTLLALLLAGGSVLGGSVATTNKVRDRRRRELGADYVPGAKRVP